MSNKVELEFVAEGKGKQVPEIWTPNGEGVSNSKHEEITEHLEATIAGGAFEAASQSMTLVQTTNPKTTKVELRQCEKTIVC